MAFDTGFVDSADETVMSNDASVEEDVRTRRFDQFNESKDVYDTSNYAKAVAHDTTDEVDIAKLVREPELTDIRWLYKSFIGSTIVDKPIDDAFKNGFSINHDPTNSVRPLLDDTKWVNRYKSAKKKARRDGFALLFFVIRDTANGLFEPSTRANFRSLEDIKVLTVDDLTDQKSQNFEQELPEKYQPPDGIGLDDTIEVRDSGIVVSRKDGDVNFGNPIGYLMNRREDSAGESKFIHASRIQHFTSRPNVDGEYIGSGAFSSVEWGSLGQWEGDSILRPGYHLIKMLFKDDWATSQTLFRYSSPLYTLTLRQEDGPDELYAARKQFRNLNSKSDLVVPYGWEVDMHETDGQLDPQSYVEPIIEQICCTVEMNKSVLFGTQTGTVTGSDSDLRNYFNQVKRMQQGEIADDIREFVKWMSARDLSVIPTFALGYTIDWEPIFEPSDLDRAEVLNKQITSIKMAQEYFTIKPNEARDLFRESIEEAGFETELEGDLEVSDFDLMMELLVAQQGNAELWPAGPESQKGNSQLGGPGRQKGSTNASTQPTTSPQ